jgi:hypothetical protein
MVAAICMWQVYGHISRTIPGEGGKQIVMTLFFLSIELLVECNLVKVTRVPIVTPIRPFCLTVCFVVVSVALFCKIICV